jgi:hypothetical protein
MRFLQIKPSSFVFREMFIKEEILFDPLTLALSQRERGLKRHSAIALVLAVVLFAIGPPTELKYLTEVPRPGRDRRANRQDH